jgi:hypothetical protein
LTMVACAILKMGTQHSSRIVIRVKQASRFMLRSL